MNYKITKRNERLKKNLINRINRIEGQVKGIKNMIEKDVYCNDVINQIDAARSALGSMSKIMLEEHIKGCIIKKIEQKEYDILDEITSCINKLIK